MADVLNVTIKGVDFTIAPLPVDAGDNVERVWVAVYPSKLRPLDDKPLEYIDGQTGMLNPRESAVSIAEMTDPSNPLSDKEKSVGQEVAQYIKSIADNMPQGSSVQVSLTDPATVGNEYDASQSPVAWISIPANRKIKEADAEQLAYVPLVMQEQLQRMLGAHLAGVANDPSVLKAKPEEKGPHSVAEITQYGAMQITALDSPPKKTASPFDMSMFEKACDLVRKHVPAMEGKPFSNFVADIMALAKSQEQTTAKFVTRSVPPRQ